MRTQTTHLRALRAAAQVARAVRRTVQWPLIAVLLPACADSAAGTTAASSDAVQGLFDAILGGDVGETSSPGGGDVALTDDVATVEDGATAEDDTSTASEGDTTLDVAAAEDTEWVSVADIEEADVGAAPDTGTVSHDVSAVDASPTDPDVAAVLTCYVPNGVVCTTEAECAAAGKVSNVCVDGECNDQDLSSEVAMACCQEQYDAGHFGVAGCNPWGPAAPPEDRGYRLADFRHAEAGGVLSLDAWDTGSTQRHTQVG